MTAAKLPLCVDCDGTLIKTDLLHESALALLKRAPLRVLALPLWLWRGKAYLKQRLSALVTIDARTLPYNQDIIQLVEAARRDGRETMLITASARSQAEAVASHLKLFDRVEATEGEVNLSGERKAERLVSLYGTGRFDYAGNGRDDLPAWAAAAGAIVVHASVPVLQAAQARSRVVRVIESGPRGFAPYARALRVHQWLKNLLVLLPIFAAHRLSDPSALGEALGAFAAFCLCASAVYVLNDLLDLPSDRQHARKSLRPFASGAIPVSHGIALIPLLFIGAFAVAASLPPLFSAALGGYVVVTCLYSLWLKNQVIVDVLLLAGLYTSRLIAGAAATDIAPSFWLLAFSMFVFLSLALIKRYSELLVVQKQNRLQAAGRGYLVSDLPVLMSLGTSSGYLAVLILALYINSTDVLNLYANRNALWLALPLLLYWMSRIWMKAHRGEVHDDPVVFAAKDWQSWLVAALLGVLVLIATAEPFRLGNAA